MPYSQRPQLLQFVGEGSCSFDGSNDYVDVSDDSTLDMGTGDFSVSYWHKSGAEIDQPFLGKKAVFSDNTAGWVIYMQNAPNVIRCRIGGGSSNVAVSATTVADDSVWHHISMVRDGDNLYLYFDGIREGSTNGVNSLDVDNSESLYMGKSEALYSEISIKNVAIWNRAVTATEVQNVMYKTYYEVSGRLASGLVSWWTLEKTLTSTTTKDVHGSNNGTLGDGITAGTAPTFNSGVYGGVVPVIPRSIDNSPKVQADAIGAGSALFVDGNSDYIDISTITLTGAFTVSAWVNPDSVTEAMILVGDTNSEDNIRMNTATVMRYIINNSSTDWTHGLTFTASEWQYMTWTRDGSNVNRMYRNGILGDTTDTKSGDFTPSIIGAKGVPDTFADYTDGKICQLGIWRGALTQEKIQSVMEKTYEELTATEKSSLSTFVEDDCADDSISAGWDSGISSNLSFDTDHYDLTYPSNNNFGMDATIVAGQLYKMTCDVKIKTDWSGNCSFFNYNGSSNIYGRQLKSDVNTSSYTTVTDYVIASGSGSGTIGFNVGAAGAISIKNFKAETVTHDLVSYWALDDGENENTTKHYTVADSMSTFGDNLLADGDAGSDNWTDDTGGTNPALVNEKSSEYAKEGTYSRKFVIDGSSDAIHTPTFTTESSAVYQVSFWIRPSATSINFYVKQGDGSGTNTTASENGSTTTWLRSFTANEWNKITTYYTESSGGSSAYLEFESPGTSDGTHYIDEVKVRKVLTGNFGELF